MHIRNPYNLSRTLQLLSIHPCSSIDFLYWTEMWSQHSRVRPICAYETVEWRQQATIQSAIYQATTTAVAI